MYCGAVTEDIQSIRGPRFHCSRIFLVFPNRRGRPSFGDARHEPVMDVPPAGDPGAMLALGAAALVGGGRAVTPGGGGTMAGESNSPPEDPGRTPTTGACPPLGVGRTSTLAESQRGTVGAHLSPLAGQRPDEAPPFGPPWVEAVGSASGSMVGGIPAGLGSSR